MFASCCVLLSLILPYALAGISAPADVLVEYMRKPTLETTSPRFFWLPTHTDRGVTQAAYQVVVSNLLSTATVWDSGKVTSSQSSHVEYMGAPLTSDTVYNVSVVWWASTGEQSPPGFAEFATGLLTQGEWSAADWIGCPLHTGSTPNYNQLRTEFNLNLAQGVKIVQARAYLSAVGYAALRVNGQAAMHYTHGDRVRNDPGWSTYELRSWYSAYDLTSSLSPTGPNAIGIWQANGWPDIGPVPGNSSKVSSTENVGENRATRMLLLIKDSTGATHTIASTSPSFTDGTGGAWACGTGSLVYDNIYNGVTWDQTLYTVGWDAPGFTGSAPTWVPALLRADPGGATPTIMSSQAFPAVTTQFDLHAISLNQPSPGVYVYDFGQNIAGFSRINLPAPVPRNMSITLRHAELLTHPPYGPADGSIYVGNLRSARATDVYVTGGVDEGFETWEPPIGTYHGFRFVEISGLQFPPDIDTVVAVFMRSDVDMAGYTTFPPTANTLNQLQHAVSWGIGNNLMSVVSDCPQRDERKGWMGDSGLSLQPTHYNYKMGAFYTAWVTLIRDAQLSPRDNHPVGSVPDTVPHTFGDYPSDPSWGTAYPGVVYSTWRMLGDTRIAADHYPNLAFYIDFMMGRCNSTGIGKLYQSYGDWCPPGPQPPKSYTSGISLLQDLQRMIELASALGKTADAAMYTATRASLVSDFNTAWYLGGGVYGDAGKAGLQTSNAAALFLNVPTPGTSLVATQATLAQDVATTHDAHWSTGIIGMRYLHASLTAGGNGSLAVDTLLQTTYPSFGYWFSGVDETPATTMWELPDAPSQGPGMNSRNHHMFASVGGYLFEDLAGIGQTRTYQGNYDPTSPEAVGFRHAVIFPRVLDNANLSSGAGVYDSMAGRYSVSWDLGGDQANCVADAPENSVAQLGCPGGVVTGVVFASFGTPTGTCAGGFSKGSCDDVNTTAKVAAQCMGKASCAIPVSTDFFGEPCFNTLKHLSVSLNCSTPAAAIPPLELKANVPTNGKATVRLPFPSSVSPSQVTITESGVVVWNKGTFVPTPGITAISPGVFDLPKGLATLDVEVLSGEYDFVLA